MTRVDARGFTLVEVVAAMLLFLLVSTAVATLSIGSMAQTIRNRYGTTAVMLAQHEVERMRGFEYADIAPATTTTEVAGIVYSIDTAVIDDAPDAGMKEITTTVTWNVKGVRGSYAIESIFTSVTS